MDTTDLTVEQTVQAVLQTSAWAPDGGPPEPVADLRDRPPSSVDGQVIWLCGPSRVGKSTIGFGLYIRLLRAGLTAGYIDADQVGFCAAGPHDHWLKASNLAAVWENYRSAGAETLVAVGPVRDGGDAKRVPSGSASGVVQVVQAALRPGRTCKTGADTTAGGELASTRRPFAGRRADEIQRAAEDAAAEAAELDLVGVGTRIDTESLTVEESVSALLREAEIHSGT